MVPETLIPIRIKFQKNGALMYISHLDLARTMQRIFVRSGIDIKYSEGFNPQPKMVFTMPLPIGTQSLCEFVDIKINSPMSVDEIKSRLVENVPEELKIVSVYTPERKLSEITYIDYSIELLSPKINADTATKIKELFSTDCIVIKSSPKGDKEVNVMPYIKSLEVVSKDGKAEINTVLCADSEKYLNPELFVLAIREKLGIIALGTTEEFYSITRKEALDSDMKIFA